MNRAYGLLLASALTFLSPLPAEAKNGVYDVERQLPRPLALRPLEAKDIVITVAYVGGMPLPFWASAGPGPPTTYVNSIQQVSITIGNGSTSNTATISAVTTANAFIIYDHFSGTQAGNQANISLARLDITNATTVTATRNTSDTSTITINGAVVDATSLLVSSVQQGVVTITASTSGTATITSVDTTRAFVIYLGHTTTSTDTDTKPFGAALRLTNATTVTATCGASYTMGVGYVVIELDAAACVSVQQFNTNYTIVQAQENQTISAVDPDYTWIAWGGESVADVGSGWQWKMRQELTSSTNVQLTSGSGGAFPISFDRTPQYTVVEFDPAVLATVVQRGVINIGTGTTSNTATISSISTTKGCVNCSGQNPTGGVGTPTVSTGMSRITLTNATTITANRNAALSSIQTNNAYETLDFN